MSKLTIDPFLFIRSPAYSYENFTEQFLRVVLSTDFFRAALFFASQTFFSELKKKDFDYDRLDPGAKLTLWKYLNRMCFRPLPYGLFSSYSAASWTKEKNEKMRYNDTGILTVQPDFKIVVNFINELQTQDFDSLKYYTNNSLYQVDHQLRFISQDYSVQSKYVVVQLKAVPGLNTLLKFISNGRTKKEILDFLIREYGDDAPAEAHFQTLVKGQLIVSALTPNITGPNYNQRSIELLQGYSIVDLNSLKPFKTVLNSQEESLLGLNEYIDSLVKKNIDNSTYSLYQRDISVGLAEGQDELRSLISNLDKLTADQDIEIMTAFKSGFSKKYEQQEVPLMVALDPEYGIGYANLATAFDTQNEDFIGDLRTKEESKRTAKWGLVEKMLFKKWNELHQSGLEKIIITNEDLKQLPDSNHHLPPGMFALFKNIDDELWIDNIGGVSGIELSARFGGSGTAIEDCLKKICAQETTVNKEYIFAEIAFSPNDRTANVNQRGHFYAYEIPVLSHAVLPEQYTIKLNDLVVSVLDNQVLIRSVRLNKYIIPRLSSAYNYQLSTLPVFRFLCDLQFQGVKSNLSFSLINLFPGLDYYPRVQLGRAVLSPATWILKEKQLEQFQEGSDFFEKGTNLPDYFSLHDGDNFLVFNKRNENDLAVFRKCIRNKKTAKLTEYVFAEQPDLQNSAGQPFASQLVACVINQSKSYFLPKNRVKKYDKSYKKVKRTFHPGEEWLYVKLYIHYSMADEILMRCILPVVKKYKKNHPEFKWFFIRYLDPDDHLRVRFYTAGKSAHILFDDLMHKLRPWSKSGKVSVILDAYQRELEKYSSILINEVESFFHSSSEFILSAFTANKLNSNFKLSFAVNTSLKIIQCFIHDSGQRMDFFNELLNNLSNEFNKDKEVVRSMDVKYRKFQKELIKNNITSMIKKDSRPYSYYLIMIQDLKDKTDGWEQADKYNLLINLVHVHINRIFDNNPREYEYLIYHFMKKHRAYLNYNTNDGF